MHWIIIKRNRLVLGLVTSSQSRILFINPSQFFSLFLSTGVGSVEGLAYHRGWDTLYWTSYTTSTITRHTVDQSRTGAFDRDTVVTMSGDDHPRAFVLDECQEYELCISNFPWCNVLYSFYLVRNPKSFEVYAVWIITLPNTKNIHIHFDCQSKVQVINNFERNGVAPNVYAQSNVTKLTECVNSKER